MEMSYCAEDVTKARIAAVAKDFFKLAFFEFQEFFICQKVCFTIKINSKNI
jgi:hypothetical protein